MLVSRQEVSLSQPVLDMNTTNTSDYQVLPVVTVSFKKLIGATLHTFCEIS